MTGVDGPAVSVVIPAYDAERTLAEQLDALRGQWPDGRWEVLVCDNGSSDGTRDLVRRLSRDRGELRLVDASGRRGPGAARNVGARAAAGDILLFCDADDVVGPGWVAAMVAALRVDDVVAGRLDGGQLNASRWFLRSGRTVLDRGLYTKAFGPGLPGGGAGNLGLRRDLFLDLGGFCEDSPTAEDVDLCWRAQLTGCSIAFVPDAVVHVRKRDTVRGLWCQGYAYGRGDAWLLRRFPGDAWAGDAVPAERRRADLSRASGRNAPRSLAGVVRRRLSTVRRLAHLADLVFDAGLAAGRRFGSVPDAEPWTAAHGLRAPAAAVVPPVTSVGRLPRSSSTR